MQNVCRVIPIHWITGADHVTVWIMNGTGIEACLERKDLRRLHGRATTGNRASHGNGAVVSSFSASRFKMFLSFFVQFHPIRPFCCYSAVLRAPPLLRFLQMAGVKPRNSLPEPSGPLFLTKILPRTTDSVAGQHAGSFLRFQPFSATLFTHYAESVCPEFVRSFLGESRGLGEGCFRRKHPPGSARKD